MKKLIIACVLTTSIATVSYAQQAQQVAPPPQSRQNRPKPPSAEDRAKQRADMFKERLGLSDAQYKHVFAAILKNEKGMDAMMKSDNMNPEGLDKLHKAEEASIRKVLTADQTKKYDEMMPKAPPHPGHAPAPQQK